MIFWNNRYSDTMEDDNKGRWARIAYAGNQSKIYRHDIKTDKHKIAIFEIAWISKTMIEDKLNFIISYKFPIVYHKYIFPTIEEAIVTVENEFAWFIKCVK